jgi:RIO-like serine/threonine protein kinase
MANIRLAQNIARQINPNWPLPIERIGEGVAGVVFGTTNGRVIKLINANQPQEYKTLKNLQGSFVVPRFKNGNGHVINVSQNQAQKLMNNLFRARGPLPKRVTVVLMGRVGNASSMTLKQYRKRFPKANSKVVCRRVMHLLREMYLRGYRHGDFHDENIIVSADSIGRITGMWVIDFGVSRKLRNNNNIKRSIIGEAYRAGCINVNNNASHIARVWNQLKSNKK